MPPSGGARTLALLALVALAAAVYALGLPGDFVYDDQRLVVRNEGLRRPFDPSRAFLRDYYASDMDRMGLGYYRPLAILANEADFRRGGGRPLAFHVTNLLLHAACTGLVFVLARRLLTGNLLAASAAALLFAVHPAHAESVAFISGRVDPLATLFVLAAVLAHLAGNGSARPLVWRVLQGVSWLAALLSKEVAVTAPLLALLLETAQEGAPARSELARRAARYLPDAAALAAYLALRFAALGTLLGPPTGEVASLARPLVVLGSYLAWLVAPPPGLHLEPAPVTGVLAALAAGLALASALAALLLWRHGRRLSAALLAWCIVTLAPVAQLRPIETVLSERFLYLPSVGSCLLLGLALVRSRKPRISALVLTVLAGIYAGVLVERNLIWRDEVRLWRAMLQEEPGSLKALLSLGRALGARGDGAGARAAYERAVQLAPAIAPTIRAEMESVAGGSEPVAVLRKALEATPGDGALWSNLGFLLLERGEAADSREAFERATALVPQRSAAWLGMALASLDLRDEGRALSAAQRALELNPDLGLARLVVAECALRGGRPCDALRMAREARLAEPEGLRKRNAILAQAAQGCPADP